MISITFNVQYAVIIAMVAIIAPAASATLACRQRPTTTATKTSATSSASPGHFCSMESMKHRPGFDMLSIRPDADTPHEVVISIRQRNIDVLDNMLMERSDPGE